MASIYPLCFSRRVFISIILTVLFIGILGFVFRNQYASADIFVADILVVDDSSDFNPQGIVFIIDPISGDRTVLTDFSNPMQGPTGNEPNDLVMEPDGNVCVVDDAAGTNEDGAIFRIDSSNGTRVIISDFGNIAQGPLGDLLQRMALFTNGNLYVVDRDAPSGDGGLFIVDKNTGIRSIVTDLSSGAQGPTASSARDVAEGPGGIILLLTSSGGTDNDGVLFEVDAITGNRNIISDFGNVVQGPTANPRWIVVAPFGNTAYVLNPSNVDSAVFSVDLISGDRQIISDFSNPIQGPTETNVQGIAIDGSGQILVNGNNTDVLFSIDPVTGFRTVISNYDNPAQGPLGSFGQGIIIASVTTLMGGGNGGGGGCALAPSGADNISFPLYLLIPCIIIVARLTRKKSIT